jgi:hypothetical protein
MEMLETNDKSYPSINVDDVIKQVIDLPGYLQFIDNAYLVHFVKQEFRGAQRYDCFFLKNEEGEIKELWGLFGRNRNSTTYAYRINKTQTN